VARDLLYGVALHDWVRELQKERGSLERLFVLAVFGDLLGVPVMSPYYTLRLLPYVVPSIPDWRRCLLREKDLTDMLDQELG